MVDRTRRAALALVLVAAACHQDDSAGTRTAPAPSPAGRPHIARTVAHPVVRRVYPGEGDPAGVADVLNRRFASLRADAAARAERGQVVVDLGPMSAEEAGRVGDVAFARGRVELRREVHDVADMLVPRIAQYIDRHTGSPGHGVGVDGGGLVAVNLPEIDADEGRRALEAYVATLPVDLRLPAGHAFAYERVALNGTFVTGEGWRAHEVAEPLIDDGAVLDLERASDSRGAAILVTLDDAHAAQLAARVDGHPDAWVALILDGELLQASGPARDPDAPLRIDVEHRDDAAELYAVLASGPLPSQLLLLSEQELP